MIRFPDISTTVLLNMLLFATSVTVVGCATGHADDAATEPPSVPVEAHPAQARTEALPIRTTGRLASKAEIQLSFKIDGIIEHIAVDEGARVQSGQTLARLNLAEIEARVLEAQSALDKARRDLARTERLHRDSVATLENLQDARTAVEVAEARVQAATFNRTYAVIAAPASGRVLRRHAEEGELVTPGTPVLTLGASGRGWVVRAGLPERDVVRLALGDSARVTFDAYPERTIPGRIAEIADAADPQTGTFEVEVAVGPEAMPLKSGFIAKLDLVPSHTAAYVEVPIAALVSGDGQDGIVFTLDRATKEARRTPVRIAQLLDSTVVLADGPAPDTPVITTGAVGLRDGDRVRRVAPR
jgi:RND family efflux transporter MFP subunit